MATAGGRPSGRASASVSGLHTLSSLAGMACMCSPQLVAPSVRPAAMAHMPPHGPACAANPVAALNPPAMPPLLADYTRCEKTGKWLISEHHSSALPEK